jgi:hypothetical protein
MDAMATLEKKNQQFDRCVGCHVVGFQGQVQSLYTTPQFANVQCEDVGPGREHANNGKGYG